MSDLLDEQLLVRYRQGHAAAFEMLISRYKQELFHFLFRYCGNRQAAEDLFQETFLQVHLSAHTFDTQRRFKPWVFTIGANKARDFLRKDSRQSHVRLDAASDDGLGYVDLIDAGLVQPLKHAQQAEVRELVQQVLMGLPGHLREVLLLSYFHRFTYREIAEMLGVPLGTIKSRLHAGVALFARNWKTKYGHDQPLSE